MATDDDSVTGLIKNNIAKIQERSAGKPIRVNRGKPCEIVRNEGLAEEVAVVSRVAQEKTSNKRERGVPVAADAELKAAAAVFRQDIVNAAITNCDEKKKSKKKTDRYRHLPVHVAEVIQEAELDAVRLRDHEKNENMQRASMRSGKTPTIAYISGIEVGEHAEGMPSSTFEADCIRMQQQRMAPEKRPPAIAYAAGIDVGSERSSDDDNSSESSSDDDDDSSESSSDEGDDSNNYYVRESKYQKNDKKKVLN